MVAVGNGTLAAGVTTIKVVAGDEASGLARIIGQYLEQLLTESSEKRDEAAALRGRLGLCAEEGDVAVTIRFDDNDIAIEEGLQDADAVISGEIEFLMHVLAGRVNPAWAALGGTVALSPGLQRPLFAYQAYHLMRLPGVHLWSGLPRPPNCLLVGAAALITTVVLVRRRQQRRGGADV